MCVGKQQKSFLACTPLKKTWQCTLRVCKLLGKHVATVSNNSTQHELCEY